jgi:enoyl-CoA hydratase
MARFNSTPLLLLMIGYVRAKEYLLTGDLMPATEAARIGLINYAVAASELDIEVKEFAN